MTLALNHILRISILLIFPGVVFMEKRKLINLGPLKNEIMEKLSPMEPFPPKTNIFTYKFWKSFNKAFGFSNDFYSSEQNQDQKALIEPSLDKMSIIWKSFKQKINHLKGDIKDSASDAVRKMKLDKIFNGKDKSEQVKISNRKRMIKETCN